MKRQMLTLIFMSLFCYQILFAAANDVVSLSSPDGSIIVNIALKEKLDPFPTGKRIYYSLQFHGIEIIIDSPFGLDFKNMPPIAKHLVIKNKKRQTIEESWERVWGKNKNVLNHCHELRLELEESKIPNRKIELIFRAYNDGVAFRYYLPEQPGIKEFRLISERSYFHFARNHTVWAVKYGGFISHQESEFDHIKINKIKPTDLIGCPLLVKVNESSWVALTEADLTDWAGMYFTHPGNIPNSVVTILSPRLDEPGVLVKSQAPRYSPWRVIMIGKTPGDLIESNIISNLNDPCELKDTSWITPGKSAWDRWWCGCYAPDYPGELAVDNPSMKYFIDFAAEMGWEYQLVDWYWYGTPFDPNKLFGTAGNPAVSILKQKPDIDIPELVEYGKKRGIKIIIWLDWYHAEEEMDKAIPLFEKWGVAGVKVDFMQRDDQDMVNFYHRLVKKAAEHHLIVDFHGAYKPTGWSRTYPNVITREGVLGLEYTKWSNRITPEHNCTVPFTRGLLGEMDFTPGGFRHKTKEAFRVIGADEPGPLVMGTRCHQLAMLVVFESALQVLCDSPFNYRNSPAGLDFLKIIPTTWDETKVIHGQVSDFITIARRSGDEWFIGSMTDWDERTLTIPLDFLGNRKYTAHIWADALDADEYPERVMKLKKTVTAQDNIVAKMAPGGGHLVYLKPIK